MIELILYKLALVHPFKITTESVMVFTCFFKLTAFGGFKKTNLKNKNKMTFYNSTHESGKQLEQRQQKADTQEAQVLAIFRSSKKGLTASEVFKVFPAKNVPIGSIRRAITNLFKTERKLVKTKIKRPGIYGASEHEYQLYTGQMILFN